jgi:eukaryotic-like serine/threonine-protein kinase
MLGQTTTERRGGNVALSPGMVVAGYTIEGVLGAGGMGRVYKARNPALPRSDA